MRRTLLGTAVVAFALLALAPAAMSGESVAPTLTVKSSSFGRVLFDGRGYVLYAFTRDANGRSACYGACAKAWPVYYSKGTVRAGTVALTAAMIAPRDTRLIGANALRGSYAKSRYKLGAIANVLVLP